ncbi:limonene-1,2-epoxide hydrolase family protein [Candidatus Symbiopectobacterium sp. NZEC135]|uniref:limonene-1,2-epoxide hydrolase family protein n=1 Tax=Candidatus Symbiopectobacterium sp. NZEC135 TaxID=2820471 RepID=UPI0022267974|nr:limonene-1,2-epoxide hydrolase family protein [Candidatus Symbiopectobacterium sp. NZEC135]MCW2479541.1 nuclear transport factor 2 family protein [Candidatus Symbiopectobacterium sp. NZEC135]
MPTPIENVTAFFAAFPEDQGKVAIQQWFTPRTVWINEGVAITTGINEAFALTDELKKTVGIATVRIEMLAIAADGNKVLTERLDRFERADGSEIGAAKVMGILELDGDRIIAWRDYFDVNFIQKVANS